MMVMSLKYSNKHLYDAIEHMLQGLCYWMGYRMECYSAHSIMESAAVDVAMSIINARLDHRTYVVKMEYPYSKMGLSGSRERADLVVLTKRDKELIPECVLEFKMANSANEGVWGDIKKLNDIPLPITRLAILLSRCNPNIIGDFVDNIGGINERAKRKVDSPQNDKRIPVRVVFVKKAMESQNTESPFRAICVELDNRQNLANSEVVARNETDLSQN